MNEYLLTIEMDCYGPYHSEEQARYAQYLFTTKHPDMAGWCSITPIDPKSNPLLLIDPRFLH